MVVDFNHHKLSVPFRTTINSHLSFVFTQPKPKSKMKSFVAVLCLVASAAAGGQFGYSTAQGTTHAVGVSAVHAAPVAYAAPAVAAPVAYAAPAPIAYAAPAPIAYAAPAPIVKTVAPVAQSTAFVNRAPAARLAVAAAPIAVAQPVAYAQPALVSSPVVAHAPAYGYQQVGLGVAGPAYL